MTTAHSSITSLSSWEALQRHHQEIKNRHLRELFQDDPLRGERLTLEAVDIYLDFSKNRLTDETVRLLLRLADQCQLKDKIEAMFSGQKINSTENRAALHTALRAPKDSVVFVDGKDVVPSVHEVLDKMSEFCDKVRGGSWLGHTGKPIRAIVNIGIGGSDLGPVMAYEALKCYSDRALTFRFVSNVDATDLVEATWDLILPKPYSSYLRKPLPRSKR